MAGMITAVAALITALVGVAAFIYQVHGGAPAPDQQAAAAGATTTPRTTAPVARPSDPATSSAPAAPPAAADAAGSGPFDLLFTNNGADLDADPPKAATGSDSSIDIYDGTGGQIVSYPVWSGLAKWSESKNPGRADCTTLLNGFAVSTAVYTKGSRFCVQTREQRHFALVEFVEPMDGGWKIRVTIWPGTG
jgi:hypothetical protein